MSRRTPNPAADRAAQNQQTIKGLLKLEGNKSCADCKRNKHPRWASWNLGIFVCIRCSGIHRGMGTHISRVKSVDLDAWTDEQLQSVLRWGNARANKYWEAKLAPGHVPSEAKIENFIRTKYESKRWVMDGPMPDPSALDFDGDDDVPLNIVQEKAKLDRSSSQRTSSGSIQQPPPPRMIAQNIDLMGGENVSLSAPPTRQNTAVNPSTRTLQQQPSAPSQSLAGLDFLGGSPDRPVSALSKPAGSNVPSRPDLKQSILSLYASAPRTKSQTQTQSQSQPQQSMQQQGRQDAFGGLSSLASAQSSSTTKSSSFGGLDDAFGGLSFGTPTSPPASQVSQQPKPSALGSFGQTSNHRSSPAAPQLTPAPLSGGKFFDAGPKPPPKPAVSKTSAPPPQALRKISNASSGFGEFASAMNPTSASSVATSTNGLLDLSSPNAPSISSARPANPSITMGTMASAFNLSKPAQPPSNYTALTQSSAPSTQTTFSGLSNADAWGSSDPWASMGTAAPTPHKSLLKSPAGSSVAGTDFGWGNSPIKSAASGGEGGFASMMQSPPGGGGFGSLHPNPDVGRSGFAASSNSGFGASASSVGLPKIAADEDFGGWNSAAPETPASPNMHMGTSAFVGAKSESQKTASSAPFKAPPAEDLWNNVWQ